MGNKSFLEILREKKIIAVIRSEEISLAVAMAKAVAKGGIELIEIPWNSHQPGQTMAILTQELPHCLIGGGTILNHTQLKEVKKNSGQFVFSPHLNLKLIKKAIKYNLPIIPGALTPSEIVKAWQGGATAVKVFPIARLGGAQYLKDLQGPLPHIPLIPTGGVTLENAHQLIKAGAVAVGVGGALFPKPLLQEGNWQKITENALKLRESFF